MNKPQSRSLLKQAKILEAAGTLFAIQGYERTTLDRVAKTSGAVIGSIEHFFGPKPALATAVHEDVVVRLTAVVEQALKEHEYDLPSTVHKLLAAYFAWARVNPHHQRILNVLTDYAAEHDANQAKGFQARIEPLLFNAVTPLMNNAKVRPFTATQLFALIMAPAMASMTSIAAVVDAEEENAWSFVLASLISHALMPSNLPTNVVGSVRVSPEIKKKKPTLNDRKGKQNIEDQKSKKTITKTKEVAPKPQKKIPQSTTPDNRNGDFFDPIDQKS